MYTLLFQQLSHIHLRHIYTPSSNLILFFHNLQKHNESWINIDRDRTCWGVIFHHISASLFTISHCRIITRAKHTAGNFPFVKGKMHCIRYSFAFASSRKKIKFLSKTDDRNESYVRLNPPTKPSVWMKIPTRIINNAIYFILARSFFHWYLFYRFYFEAKIFIWRITIFLSFIHIFRHDKCSIRMITYSFAFLHKWTNV